MQRVMTEGGTAASRPAAKNLARANAAPIASAAKTTPVRVAASRRRRSFIAVPSRNELVNGHRFIINERVAEKRERRSADASLQEQAEWKADGGHE